MEQYNVYLNVYCLYLLTYRIFKINAEHKYSTLSVHTKHYALA